MPRNATQRGRLGPLALCLSALLSAPAAMGQVAEPSEQADHTSMSGHHMNFSMGWETCAPTYTYQDGPVGPDRWSGVCQTGNMQSPVNIRGSAAIAYRRSSQSSATQPADLDVINDCNAQRILVRFPDNDWLKIGKKPYFLSGTSLSSSRRERRERRGGRVMSVQLVHLDAEGERGDHRSARGGRKGKPGHESRAGTRRRRLAKPTRLCGASIDATDFLPADRSFYRVPGSLTGPDLQRRRHLVRDEAPDRVLRTADCRVSELLPRHGASAAAGERQADGRQSVKRGRRATRTVREAQSLEASCAHRGLTSMMAIMPRILVAENVAVEDEVSDIHAAEVRQDLNLRERRAEDRRSRRAAGSCRRTGHSAPAPACFRWLRNSPAPEP